ncbi:MAG: hypothetical protein KKH94_12515 [Candidatus Omnitrophica bacterium]|nr:hypothetical protein [Candidatus Omnitrophota bacterium]
MKKGLNHIERTIHEKAKSEYTRSEVFSDEKMAKRKMIEYRRAGYYFAVCVYENGLWRLLIA